MDTNRRTAIIVGVLFLLGFSGAITAALTKPILDDPNYLAGISASANQVMLGAFLQFVMAAACAGIGISLFPVLRRYSQGLALGAAGFRMIEGALGIVGVVGLVLLLALSQEYVRAGSPDPSYFQTMGVLIRAGSAWVNNVGMILAWCIGALIYYSLFYQHQLIPRWLAGWGLAGIALAIASSLLVMFRLIVPFGTISGITNLPIALQEMVLAVWLIVKGFNPSAIAAESA